MAAMNKYTVWTGEGTGEFVVADLIVSFLDTVSFYLMGQEVKTYNRKSFLKYNPDWKLLENTE